MIRPTVPPILDRDAVDERADDLLDAGLNGLRMVRVTFEPPAGPDEARLEVWFHNALHVDDVLAEATASPSSPWQVFRIRGGHRLPAGPGSGQVRVTAVQAGETDEDGETVSLVLTVSPIGDYSTYNLELAFDPDRIDPYFAELDFRFRPGCFTHDCDPPWEPGREPRAVPAVDYLARDYDSFRHLLITAMMERVPGWEPTSEADLDQTLIDLFAAAGDELADYQDRVMAEAYLGTARKRVSIVRHARLMDYHVHEGNQSSTWLAVRVGGAVAPFTLDDELLVHAGHPEDPDGWIWFSTRQTLRDPADRALLDPLLNELRLHTWSHTRPALPAGATSADLVSALPGAGRPGAERVRDLVNDGVVSRLVLEEKLNPRTGREPGRDPRHRQLLRLLPEAEAIRDPLTDIWVTRVRWRAADALTRAYSFTTHCPDGRVENVSVFHGNLLRVYQGLPVEARFHPPEAVLPEDEDRLRHRPYERWTLWGEERGVLCRLPWSPLAYLPTPAGGEVPARSTARVTVDIGGVEEVWDEVPSLVHSDDSAEEGDHFVVETDELRRSTLRFGNGVNGRLLPDDAVVHCAFQVGGGAAGNVGAGTLAAFHAPSSLGDDAIEAVWNPFDVVDGREPEPVERVLRRAPEAYRARQLRAVTLADYVRRAEEVPGVARAVARYAWTGSWRTVRVVVDPEGVAELDPELREAVSAHLEAVRLIGEDLEIRPPRFVPLAVEVTVCLRPDVWAGDVRAVLEQELSAGYTADGRPGLFHPDAWTFGQPLHASEIAGRVQPVAGVDHVKEIRMRRFATAWFADPPPETLEVAFDEIVLVENDPDAMERGSVTLILDGGRR